MLNVPVQFHTGMRWGELGVGELNHIHLEEALDTFPRVRFELMHGGYPYLAETSVLGANTPNVYLNLSWLTTLSYDLSVEWLGQLLDMVPNNKITIGWDVFNIETLCGACVYTRQMLAEVLAKKVGAGLLREEQCTRVAKKLMYENAARLYGISLRLPFESRFQTD
jgi:predicted TIM-barrel fold metal-dependent hydrolase